MSDNLKYYTISFDGKTYNVQGASYEEALAKLQEFLNGN